MKNKKIICGFILAACVIIWGTVYGDYFFPAIVRVEIPPGNYSGSNININITVDTLGQPVSGAQMNIYFNKSIKINEVKEGNLFNRNNITFFFNGTLNNSNGTVKNIFTVILGPGNTSVPGTFIILNVTVLPLGNTTQRNLMASINLSGGNGYNDPRNGSYDNHTLLSTPEAEAMWLKEENSTLIIRVPAVLVNCSCNPSNAGNKTLGASYNITASGKNQWNEPFSPVWKWTADNASRVNVTGNGNKGLVIVMDRGSYNITVANGTVSCISRGTGV